MSPETQSFVPPRAAIFTLKLQREGEAKLSITANISKKSLSYLPNKKRILHLNMEVLMKWKPFPIHIKRLPCPNIWSFLACLDCTTFLLSFKIATESVYGANYEGIFEKYTFS